MEELSENININRTTDISDEQVADIIRFHLSPIDGRRLQNAAGRGIAAAIGTAFATVIRCAPPSADRSTALRKLREAMADANNAVNFDGAY